MFNGIIWCFFRNVASLVSLHVKLQPQPLHIVCLDIWIHRVLVRGLIILLKENGLLDSRSLHSFSCHPCVVFSLTSLSDMNILSLLDSHELIHGK